MSRKLNLIETEIAIKKIKDHFEVSLGNALDLTRVSAPLFVEPNTGLNDDLSGVEKFVTFQVKDGKTASIVQSLAKWKRMALAKYRFPKGKGLYTDMNAIRKDEVADALHSYYVDQWDWEKIIDHDQRNLDTLRLVVEKIYECLKETEKYVNSCYPGIFQNKLPEKITFITSQELEDMYPNIPSSKREYEYVKKHGAIFVSQIGKLLNSGEIHDMRAPDYDDWEMNGDIIFYHKPLDCAFEISSMGVRVDHHSLHRQLSSSNNLHRLEFSYHKSLMNNEYPLTIGGGIGQSRICMFFLEKIHIGEVQSSIWPDEEYDKATKMGAEML